MIALTLVFAGIQLSITRVPDAQKAEEVRRWRHLLDRIDQARHESLRQRLLSGHGTII